MERQRIYPVLLIVLLAAAVFLGGYFLMIYRDINYLPKEGLDNLWELMKADHIFFDRDIVPMKKESGSIYVSAPKEYGSQISVLLGESEVKYGFTVPEGEIILLNNGALFEFKSDFYFHYQSDRNRSCTTGIADESFFSQMTPLSPEDAKEEVRAAKAFLEQGSRGFDMKEKLNLATEVTRCFEEEGILYVECVRTMDGAAMTENRAVCVVRDGDVVEAAGTWCFLTPGESHVSQLTDIFNILFSVKKEIGGIRESEEIGDVTILDIDSCYTLYNLSDNGGICFVPCWKIVTDVCGDFVFNAVDGSLCTETTVG